MKAKFYRDLDALFPPWLGIMAVCLVVLYAMLKYVGYIY